MHSPDASPAFADHKAAATGRGVWPALRPLRVLRPGLRRWGLGRWGLGRWLPALRPGGTPGFAGVRRGRAMTGFAAGTTALMVLAGAAWSDTTDPANVTIDNFTFAPAMIDIRQGQMVTWTNRDDIPHVIVVPGAQARSKTLDTDDSYALLFEKAGTFDYICGLHPAMRGKVVVH